MKREALVCLVVLSSCGGASTTGGTSTTPGPSGATAVSDTAVVRPREVSEYPSPPAPWAEMDAAARGSYMAQSIVPYFRALFQEYDPERYATFGCPTCHGATATQRAFAMPNPDLLALHPSGSAEQIAMRNEHPRMVKLMFNHVVPAMKHAVQAEDFDETTGAGFSCYTCHPAAGGE